MEALSPTEQHSYTALLKKSFSLYGASFFRVFIISLLLSFIAFIPRFIANIIGSDKFLDLGLYDIHQLWLLLINWVCIILFISILWRTYCVTQGRHEPFLEDLLLGLKKFVPVIIATCIQSAIVFIVIIAFYGLLTLFDPYQTLLSAHFSGMIFIILMYLVQIFLIVYLLTLFIFLIPLIAIEKKGILSALKRSAYLVWNHWWRVFSVQFTPWLSYFILLMVLRYLFHLDIHIYLMKDAIHPWWASLLQLLIFAIFIPWVAALLLVQLKDLEVRKHIE